jgi:hypothetical protein
MQIQPQNQTGSKQPDSRPTTHPFHIIKAIFATGQKFMTAPSH